MTLALLVRPAELLW